MRPRKDNAFHLETIGDSDFDIRISSFYELVSIRARQAEPVKDGPFHG